MRDLTNHQMRLSEPLQGLITDSLALNSIFWFVSIFNYAVDFSLVLWDCFYSPYFLVIF